MEQFLDMSFRDLFEQFNNLAEALYRSYDRLNFIINMVFPACVLRTIDCKSGDHIHIMTDAFYEIHYRKIIDEYKLHNTINRQLIIIRKIRELFTSYGVIKFHEYILQETFYQKFVNICISCKPRIYIYTPNGKYIIQLSHKMYDEFEKWYFKK